MRSLNEMLAAMHSNRIPDSLYVAQHDRCMSSEHVSPGDQVAADALLAIMEGDDRISQEIKSRLEGIRDGKECICSEPGRYIKSMERYYHWLEH